MRERAVSARSGMAEIAGDLTGSRLPATVAIGLVFGFVNGLFSVALMSLIFSGDLRDALPLGIGVGLTASAALALVIGTMSRFPGMYGGIQDNSAAILTLAGASIATAVVGPDAVDSVIAMMATVSLGAGVLFLVMGRFHLGEIARYVPFPVVGGLLAGTGFLILRGGFGLLQANVDDPLAADGVAVLWAGLALAGAFLLATLLHWSSRTYLLMLVSAIAAFHVISRLAGVGQAAALDRGWMLGPFPEGGLWPGLAVDALAGADWGAVAGEAANLGTILVLAPLTFLLYLSAVEVGTNSDLDTSAELRATGWANLAAGALGGPPGFVYLSDTLFAHRLGGARRGAVIVASLSLVGLTLVGSTVLEFLPQFVIGGLLVFVGIDFLLDWLWRSRHRMSRLDYVLMVGIVATIATVGFLEGVAAGVGAAIVLFVYRYSRIDVVKHQLTAREHRSNIERPIHESEYLNEVGEAVLILELQGFIFFGTANQIVDTVKRHLQSSGNVRHIVFDFRLVTGVDSSAVALFERIAALAREHGFQLVLSGLRPSARAQFAQFADTYGDILVDASDLDHGMAWCEDQLLQDLAVDDTGGRSLPEDLTMRLGAFLRARTIDAGEHLMTQGDPTPGIFLITSGRATVLLHHRDGTTVRLRTLREGTVLGEIGLYMGEPCTASVVADTVCKVLHLTPDAFNDLCQNDPSTAADLHAFVARTLAARVSHANRTIQALHG